jgi:hypothetical protein
MQHHTRPDPATPAESFPTDPSGLPEAGRPAMLELADGDTLDLRIGPVAKRLGDTTVRMLPTTAPSPAPPSRSNRTARSSSTLRTTGIWTPPCTGTGCGWKQVRRRPP